MFGDIYRHRPCEMCGKQRLSENSGTFHGLQPHVNGFHEKSLPFFFFCRQTSPTCMRMVEGLSGHTELTCLRRRQKYQRRVGQSALHKRRVTVDSRYQANAQHSLKRCLCFITHSGSLRETLESQRALCSRCTTGAQTRIAGKI